MKSQTTVGRSAGRQVGLGDVGRRSGAGPGGLAVEANAVSQTASVTYDPDRTDVAQLSRLVRGGGSHCGGASVPSGLGDFTKS